MEGSSRQLEPSGFMEVAGSGRCTKTDGAIDGVSVDSMSGFGFAALYTQSRREESIGAPDMFQMYPGGQGTAVPFSTFWRMHLKLHFSMAVISNLPSHG